ncbi:MAG: hypothetical protein GXO09_03780 [Crenarchaeota archaeon]|nr:hypothetical protein [Thermoproteota archaeon]
MTQRFDEIIRAVRRELSRTSSLMSMLSELMIVSEMWEENGKINIIAWIPDIEKGVLKYRKKHIIYDPASKRIQCIKDLSRSSEETTHARPLPRYETLGT